MIRLEKIDESSYDQLISWIDSEESLMQFAGPGFTYPLTMEQLEKSLQDEKRIGFKVIDMKSGSMIGYSEIYLSGKSAYLARILIGDKELRGRGIGQKIVSQLLFLAFTEFNQSKVELNVFDWNISAIKCYEKAGFVINTAKTAERKINGKTWIALNMSLDRSNWNPKNS